MISKNKFLLVIGLIGVLGFMSPVGIAFAFIGPSAGQSPGSGGGAFTVDSSRNVGFGTPDGTPGTAPSGESFGKIFTIASTTNPGIALKNLSGGGRNYVWFSRNNGRLALWDVTAQAVRLVVHTNGNIGIASSTPASEKLHVFGNVKADGSFVGSVSGAVSSANVTSEVFGSLQGNGNFAFPANLGVATSSQDGLPQTFSVYGGGYFSGSVGIGTTGPSQMLHMYQSGATDVKLLLESDAKQAAVIIDSGGTGGNADAALALYYQGAQKWQLYNDGDDSHKLKINDDAGTLVTIQNDGNVGIGTTAPSELLHVKGSVQNEIVTLRMQGITPTDGSGYLQFDSQNDFIALTQTLDSMTSGIGVAASGNVGIATTTPAYTLDVWGTGRFLNPIIIGAPIVDTHAATKKYVDDSIGGGSSDPSFNTLTVSGTSTLATTQGRVGIGTAGPNKKLHVEVNSNDDGISVENGGTRLLLIAQEGGDAGRIRLYDGGSEKISLNGVTGSNSFFNTGGNVGIGTVSPGAQLHVKGPSSDGTIYIWNNAETQKLRIDQNSIRTLTANDFSLFTLGNSPQLVLSSGGNVGIATTTPAYKLQVYGTASFSQPVIVGDPVSNVHAATKLYVDDAVTGGAGTGSFSTLSVTGTSTLATTQGRVGIGTVSPSEELSINANIAAAMTLQDGGTDKAWFALAPSGQGGMTDNDLVIRSDGARMGFSMAGSEKMSLLSSGNVGIGNTGPDSLLELTGGNIKFGDRLDSATRYIGKSAAAGADVTGGNANWIGFPSTGTDDYLVFGTHKSGTGGGERMRIDALGNVGIGTTGPGSKLDVDGGAVTARYGLHVDTAVNGGAYQADDLFRIINFDNDGGAPQVLMRVTDENGIDYFKLTRTTNSDTNPDSDLYVRGNLGIATTTPAYKLQVYGTSAFSQPVIVGDPVSNVHAATKLYVDDAVTGGAGTGSFSTLAVTGTSTLATTQGRVGIGTTNPGDILHIAGGSSNGLSISGTANPTLKFDESSSGDSNIVADIRWDALDSGAAAQEYGRIRLYAESDNAGAEEGGIRFRLANGTGGFREDIVFQGDGNVGIGTTGPNAKLEVAGNIRITGGSELELLTSGGNERGTFFAQDSSPHLTIRTSGGEDIQLGDGNPSIFIEGSNDNVGINDATPSYKLDVNGTSRFTQPVIVSDPTANAHAATKLYVDDAVTGGAGTGSFATLSVTGTSTLATTQGRVGIGTVSPDGKLDVNGTLNVGSNDRVSLWECAAGGGCFAIDNSAGTRVVQLRGDTSVNYINNGGNFGIGTASPDAKLDVNGDIRIPNAGKIVFGSAGAPTDYLQLWDVTTGSPLLNLVQDSSSKFYIEGSSGNVGIGATNPGSHLEIFKEDATIRLNDVTDGGVEVALRANDENFEIVELEDTSSAPQSSLGGHVWFQVSDGGNIGIGTTGPSYKLDVNGTARFVQPIIVGTPTTNAHAATKLYVDDAVTGGAGTGSFSTLSVTGTSTLATTQGRVGIGTGSPGAKLEVAGNVSFDSGTWTFGTGGTNGWFGDWVQVSNTGLYATGGGHVRMDLDNIASNFQVRAVGDVVAFSVSGDSPVDALVVDAQGEVGIGDSTPSYKLDVSGTSRFTQPVIVADPTTNAHAATKLYVDTTVTGGTAANSNACSGDATCEMNAANLQGGNITGVNKLTVTTIDPLYQIGKSKYATYAASIAGGVKEEFIGKAKLASTNQESGIRNYEHVIDFGNLKEGLDLWVWYKTVDFSKDNVDVLVTPYGQVASIYYVIKGDKIIFRGDSPAEFSYRLVGKRFDWREWPTLAKDQNEKASLIVR
ncbi:MAG: hypothetical protein KJI72_01595 [Patescibacteria group bacterium]|nr:hypothetical protein [Patescibacteria group bacterium]